MASNTPDTKNGPKSDGPAKIPGTDVEGGPQDGASGLAGPSGPAALRDAAGGAPLRDPAGKIPASRNTRSKTSTSHYGIVCLQETHTSLENSITSERAENWREHLLDLGWLTFFSHGTRNSAGVCIAIDAILLDSGILQALDEQSICNNTPGRGIKIRIKWAGHDFDLINVYLPNNPTEQKSFLQILQPEVDPQRPTLIAGDFNFVECRAVDRHRGNSSNGDPAHTTWKTLFSSFTDTYRRLHPRRREFSFFHRDQRSASRIDRVHASHTLLPYISNSNISSQHGPSDHNPVYITLAGKSGVPRAAGRPRVRLGFTKVPKLHDLFLAGATQIMPDAPSEMNQLIHWTPGALNKIAILGRRLHAASRANKPEALESVEKDLQQLREQYQQGGNDHILAQLMSQRKEWQSLWYTHCETSDIHNYRKEIHRGERVTAGKAAALCRPAFSGTIPGLKNDLGRVVVRTAAATVAAKHYANVSKQPNTCPIAQQQVLGAVSARQQLPTDLATVLGNKTFNEAEILEALKEIGITVRGRRFTASQFADDAEVFLPDQSAVPKFLETMRTFEKASGQKLNVEKTKILKIGAHPTFTAATELHGIPVAPTAKALGIIFSQFTGDPIKNFEPLIAKLDRSYSSISNWRFTIFGRAHATGCYGVTRLLHHAEYSGLLTIAQQQHLTKITAKLVDRGQAPSDPEHVFAGLHQEILFGRREEGGFGAFPWKQHIQARHAVLGLKIITGDPTIPWISAARDLLQDAGLDIWTIVWDRTSIVNLEIGGHLGCCLAALRELPAPEMLEALPAPGPWCFDAPLWGYLPHYKTIENNTYCLEEQMARVLSNIAHSSIRTLGQLALASYLSLSYELQPSLYGTGVAHD
ncbi:hypothetical protein Ndes2437A_g03635 [Nannochloris sp. 'desiccata']